MQPSDINAAPTHTVQVALDINSFPPEILSAILLASISKLLQGPTLVEWANAFLTGKKLITTTPLLLGSVCRLWRHVVWSSPRMWTFISLWVSSRTVIDLDVLSAWLRRSNQLPLFIGVSGSSLGASQRTACRPWIDVLKQHSARWHELYLNLPLEILSLFHPEHTALEILFLKHDLTPFQGPRSIDFRNACPTDLELHGIWVSTIDIQWDNIRRAFVDSVRVEDCLEFIRRAARVEYFKISYMTSAHPEFVHFTLPASPIIQDSLRTLELDLSGSTEDSISNFWSSTTLPNLNVLKLVLKSLQVDSFEGFLKRSAFQLMEFRLQFSEAGNAEDNIRRVLKSMQYLRKLSLHPCSRQYSPDGLLQHLARTCVAGKNSSGDEFLPYLESIEYFSEKGISWDLLAGIFGQPADLRSTVTIRRPLKHAKIRFENYSSAGLPLVYMGSKTMQHFALILDGGNKIDITFPDPETDGYLQLGLEDIMERSRRHWHRVEQTEQ